MNQGGLNETVIHGETGLLIDSGALDERGGRAARALSEAVCDIDSAVALEMRSACEEQARNFGPEKFDSEFKKILGG